MNDGDDTTTRPGLTSHSCGVKGQHAMSRGQGINNNNKSPFGPARKFFLFFFSFRMFTNYFTDHFSYYPACKPLLAGWINDREGGQEPPQ
jgi:hypothetical protein